MLDGSKETIDWVTEALDWPRKTIDWVTETLDTSREAIDDPKKAIDLAREHLCHQALMPEPAFQTPKLAGESLEGGQK